MMIKAWDDFAWEDYLYWQKQDRKTLKSINQLLQDIDRNGYSGISKSEQLKGDFQGYWSHRIDETNRLIYRIVGARIEILQCRSHYGPNAPKPQLKDLRRNQPPYMAALQQYLTKCSHRFTAFINKK